MTKAPNVISISMSIRGLWILSVKSAHPDQSESRRLLFSRHFPIVEKKVKLVEKENYITLPTVPEFINGLMFELGHKDGIDKFITARDTCEKFEQKPVYEVMTSAGPIWPVVVVEQRGIVYCCLPLVTQGINTRPPLIQIPGVTLGFSLLCGLSDYLRQNTAAEIAQKGSVLNVYLNTAAPFGKPMDVSPETVMSKVHNKPSLLSKTHKQPAWKPVLHRGKNQVYLAVTEYIRANQYNKEGTPDIYDLYGSISCKAELEGAQPDITLSVSHTPDGNNLPLDHLIIHPCVQSADATAINMDDPSDMRATPRRVRFIPPTEMFILCHYTVSSLKELPIKGSYEMRMDGKTAKLTVRLKMSERVKNNLEYCELQIPFHNRGTIGIYDATPSQGNVMVSPDRRILVWNVGQKFPTKSLTISLEATVNFTDSKTPATHEDAFCVGQNSYAKLFFKLPDFTHSGCQIDPKSVQVSPNVKFKLTTVQEYLTGMEYKLWNNLGDSLVSNVPHSVLNEVKVDDDI